jgi:hypothetical protein
LVRKTAITQVSLRRSSIHAGAYGNGVLEPSTAAALLLTPQLESYVRRSTADVSEAGISYSTSHGGRQVQRFLGTRAIGLKVFAHTSFFLPQTDRWPRHRCSAVAGSLVFSNAQTSRHPWAVCEEATALRRLSLFSWLFCEVHCSWCYAFRID